MVAVCVEPCPLSYGLQAACRSCGLPAAIRRACVLREKPPQDRGAAVQPLKERHDHRYCKDCEEGGDTKGSVRPNRVKLGSAFRCICCPRGFDSLECSDDCLHDAHDCKNQPEAGRSLCDTPFMGGRQGTALGSAHSIGGVVLLFSQVIRCPWLCGHTSRPVY